MSLFSSSEADSESPEINFARYDPPTKAVALIIAPPIMIAMLAILTWQYFLFFKIIFCC